VIRLIILIIVLNATVLIPDVYAYVGPGLGLGAIGAFVGMVLAVLLAIVGVVWYPLKRMLNGMSRKKASTKPAGTGPGNSDAIDTDEVKRTG